MFKTSTFGAVAILAAICLSEPAWALGSTPVTVVNPANNPALTSSVDDPGRVAYQSFLDQSCAQEVCSFSFPAVPADHRLVIQHVSSAGLAWSGTPTPAFVGVSIFGHANTISGFSAPIMGSVSTFDQSVLYYIDAGETPRVAAAATGFVFSFNSAQFLMLSGYLLDCKVSACAPIAH